MKINLRYISFVILTLIVLIQLYINYIYKDYNSLKTETIILKKKDKNKLIEYYGTPSNVTSNNGNRIFIWNFIEPKPWSILVNDPSLQYPLVFGFKFKTNIKQLNKWKQIIPNLEYKDNIIYIPSKDEESALALLNLILNNLFDELSINEIVKNNLIPLSIKKIKAHTLVKNKIIDQIMEKIKNKEPIRSEHSVDLANYEKINAYGGGEFAFL